MSSADKKKLTIALALFAVLAAVLAWNFGLFDGTAPAPAPAVRDEGQPLRSQPRVAPGVNPSK